LYQYSRKHGPFLCEAQWLQCGSTCYDWYLEYVLDHFQNLINSLVVHNLPVPQSSYQSAPNSFSYSANNKTNMGQSTIPANLWRR